MWLQLLLRWRTYLIRLLDRCYLFAKFYEIMKLLFTSIVTSVI